MQTEQIESCKTAQLHLGESIQDYGAFFLVNRDDGSITACSANLERLLGRRAAGVLGLHCCAVLDQATLQPLLAGDSAPRRLCMQWQLGGREFMVALSAEQHQILVELVPGKDSFSFDINDRIGFLDSVSHLNDATAVAEHLLDSIAAITGFCRVMLYKFLPEWHGKVIAERLHPGVRGYLNQHFPAGDIPENARRLYTINLQRYIMDAAGAVSPIVGPPRGQRLDLTSSQLRAVHPVHIQYLHNIGVRSSFSVSILAAGKLWGMIACHHEEVRALSFKQRFMCEELSRIASLRISALLAVEAERQRGRLHAALAQVEARIVDNAHPEHALRENLGTLCEIFAADSVLLKVGKQRSSHGPIARSGEVQVLRDWLAHQSMDAVWHRNVLPPELASHEALLRHASGMLLLPLGSEHQLLLLRNELSENIEWAGRPPHHDAPDRELTPRASFESWMEQTQGHALRWSAEEVDAAEHFSRSVAVQLDKMQLKRIALEDSLTGLSNRRHFEEELQSILDLHKKRPNHFAVFMLDLDKFKQVNDTLGHAAGDELLIQVAARLTGLLRSKDTVARLGGDEFALIQHNAASNEAVELVASRILQELRKPYELAAGHAEIGVSIGIALHPRDGNSMDDLLQKADKMLYAVKKAGRNAWRIWPG